MGQHYSYPFKTQNSNVSWIRHKTIFHKESEDSSKEKHKKDVSALKQTFKSHKMNPIDSGPARTITQLV